MNGILELASRLWKGFDSLSTARKISIAIAGGLTLAVLAAMVYVTNHIDYRVLYSNLSGEDASAIINRLKERKISYQLSGTGDSILVPGEKISELRVELAASGIPQGGGVGYEIFDRKAFGTTEFEQELNYRRALQGELARTINGLDAVQFCRVHIALPKKSLFVAEKKDPSASVTVRLKPGRKLSAEQVDGIVHLIASSVEGMTPEGVMIVDSTGNILSRNRAESGPGKAATAQIEYQARLEGDLAQRIQTMLERVVGQGKSVVRVSADMDFRMTEKTEEVFDPESQVIRSLQRQTEKIPLAGRAGESAESGAGEEGKERSDETINYEINKVMSRTVMPVGEIRRLSIAVAVDGFYEKDQEGKEVFQSRSKKELDSLENLVRKSAGFDAARGDQVVMTCMSFRQDFSDEGIENASIWGTLLSKAVPVLKYIILLSVFVFAFLFVIRPIVRNLLERADRAGAREVREVSSASVPRIQTAPSLLAGPAGGEMTEVDMARQLAKEDPKKFAELLRNWLR
jgi:flagellar M-ring protein FliF